MQGIPGSGKSIIAHALRQELGQEYCCIHSTDSYFTDPRGFYHFDASKLREYHELNQRMAQLSLEYGFPIVIIDNTNIKHDHARPYIELGRQNGYEISVVRVDVHPEVAILRNSNRPPDRQIPEDVIYKMHREMESIPV